MENLSGNDLNHIYFEFILNLHYTRYYNFATPTLLVMDFELAKKVLSTEFDNFVNHMPFARRDGHMGESLFTVDDGEWKEVSSRTNSVL